MSFTYVNKIWLIGSAFQLELHSWYHWRMQLKGIEQDILVYKGLEKTELLRTFLIKVCYLEKKNHNKMNWIFVNVHNYFNEKSHVVLKGGLSMTLSYLFRTVCDFSCVGACRFETHKFLKNKSPSPSPSCNTCIAFTCLYTLNLCWENQYNKMRFRWRKHVGLP